MCVCVCVCVCVFIRGFREKKASQCYKEDCWIKGHSRPLIWPLLLLPQANKLTFLCTALQASYSYSMSFSSSLSLHIKLQHSVFQLIFSQDLLWMRKLHLVPIVCIDLSSTACTSTHSLPLFVLFVSTWTIMTHAKDILPLTCQDRKHFIKSLTNPAVSAFTPCHISQTGQNVKHRLDQKTVALLLQSTA